jgi:hypothetical protein
MSWSHLLTNRHVPSGWMPKEMNELRVEPFPLQKWRTYYYTSNDREKNNVLKKFNSAYGAWRANFNRRRAERKAQINATRQAFLRELRAARTTRSVSRRSPTPRRENQKAAARHAGSVRSTSLRRRVLTAHLPPNAAARARANAQLTRQLQSLVNQLKANLKRNK